MADYQDDDYDSDPMTPDAEESPPVKSPFIGPPTQPAAPVPAPNQALESDAPAPINPVVASYLKNKQDMIAAQKLASDNQFSAQMARALGTFAHGVTGAKGPFDQSGYDALDKSAQTPVANLNALQRAGAQSVADEQAMQVAQEAQKKREAEADPNSPESKMAQNLAKQMMPNSGTQFDGLPASRILQLLPSLKGIYEVRVKHEDREAATETRGELAKYHADMVAATKDDKKSKDDAKAITDFYDKESSFRGNKSVQNAAEALRNSDQAMEIIKANPDYNNINSTQYNMLTAEIAKIASGGAATEAAAHDVRAQTLQSKAAAFWQTVSGKPTGAQLGAFIQQNKDYLEGLNQVNHRYVDEFKANHFRAYKDRIPDTTQQEYLENNPGVAAIVNRKGPAQQAPVDGQPQGAAQPVARKTADGRIGLFDPSTKAFLRYQ